MSIVFEVSKCVDCPCIKEEMGAKDKLFCEDGKFYVPIEEWQKISKFCPHMSKEDFIKKELLPAEILFLSEDKEFDYDKMEELLSKHGYKHKGERLASDTCPRSCELPSTSNQNTHETMGG